MFENEEKCCVKCSVKNCVHHSPDNYCRAQSIEVGNSTACCQSETCCDTFKLSEL
ncbi:MAG: DUF1540 domain-containing protein [Clostridia bacterium]|nr:DUF1540 domain-containing protein [Clostridia bacterium]